MYWLAGNVGLVTWLGAKKYNYPTLPQASLCEIWQAFRNSIWGLLIIVIVIGGKRGDILVT